MGSVDSTGEGPAGEGNRGVISGERVGLGDGGDDRGGSNGRTAGAAEITEMGTCDEANEAIETINNVKRVIDHLVAIKCVCIFERERERMEEEYGSE